MKKLIIGMVIGLMLGLSTNAFAEIGDIVSAKFASFNFVVNGDAKTLDSPVLVYEGTSYLRTTDLANMLGYDVTYKSDSRTIAFNKDEPAVTISPTPIPVLATPDPVTGITPSAEPTATPDPNATPTATPSPTPSVEPTATPWVGMTPEQRALCNNLRQDPDLWNFYGCY